MLRHSKLQPIVLTAHLAEAERFYSDVLGLHLRRHSNGNAIYDVGDGDLVLGCVPANEPSEHTVLGFAVDDLDVVIAELAKRGIRWARFDGLPHDERGVVKTSDGDRVIWFRDPDGNILSIVQYSG